VPDIFLSYSREDQATARRFAEAFQREGVTVWWDQTLRSGENYDQVTEAALREAKAVVVLWSKHSVDSRWVRAEATQADRNGTLMPAMIEPCNRPIMFELKHTAELAHWKGDAGDPAWRTFLADVRLFVKKEGPPTLPAAATIAKKSPIQFGVRTLAGIAALLVIVAGVFWLAHRASKPVTLAGTAAATSSSAAKEVTLAVLPFVNLSSDPEQDYFSDGLTEEILNQLAQFKDLHVIGRTSSFSFKGKNEDLRVVGKKLGAANVLEGSVRKSGDDLRITAQLISSSDGTHLWSETYKEKLVNIFDVQEKIAKAVAGALRVALAPGQSSQAIGGTTNLQAYDAYLVAKAIVRSAKPNSSDQIIAGLEKAVTLDPLFSNAWATLASAYTFAGDDGSPAPYDQVELRRRASAALVRALELTPNSPRALGTAAVVSMRDRDWREAERRFRQASEQAPALDYDTNQAYGWFLLTVGRSKESSTYFLRAQRAEPLSAQPSYMLSVSYVIASEAEKADAEISNLNRFNDPALTVSIETVRALAIRDQVALRKLTASDASGLGEALRQGFTDPTVAIAALRKVYEDPANRKGFVQMSAVSQWAAYFGDEQLALQALRALSPSLESFVIWEPNLTRVRQLRGFKDLVRDLKLVDYWRSSGNWGDFCKPVGKDDFECH
jgi:TolB-like protein